MALHCASSICAIIIDYIEHILFFWKSEIWGCTWQSMPKWPVPIKTLDTESLICFLGSKAAHMVLHFHYWEKSTLHVTPHGQSTHEENCIWIHLDSVLFPHYPVGYPFTLTNPSCEHSYTMKPVSHSWESLKEWMVLRTHKTKIVLVITQT